MLTRNIKNEGALLYVHKIMHIYTDNYFHHIWKVYVGMASDKNV